ncbi:MAG: hydantoinase/oxoprolinase family protein, partial [Aquificae bacterium]|nr:hydantoinase/oxoprolinase family protein [Aquificota bacterium]
KLGVSPEELAEAIINIANSNMERAIKNISVERGENPEEFALLSFGGAGGLHAVFLARSLSIPTVIVPKNPGLLSAMGMLLSDIVKDTSSTVMLKEEEATRSVLENAFKELEEKLLSQMEKEGFKEVVLSRFADVRYRGQSYEIIVPYGENLKERFEELHEKLYGYRHEGRPIEVVNLRVVATATRQKPPLKPFEKEEKEIHPSAVLGKRNVLINGEWVETLILDREKLLWGNTIDFPALVVEYSSTTFIPPGAKARVDRYGNLIISV